MPIKHKLTKIVLVSFTVCLFLINTSCTKREQEFGIIFSANIDGNQDLYVSSSQDFNSIRRITFTPNNRENDLKITRNGKTAFFSLLEENLTSNSYVLDLENMLIKKIITPEIESKYSTPIGISFDDQKVILLYKYIPKIYSMSFLGKNIDEVEIPLTFNNSAITYIDYSPDGYHIAYTEQHNPIPPFATASSFIYNIKTKNVIDLINDNTKTCKEPKWSPNGENLLIACDLSIDGERTDSQLYLFEIKNNNIKQIASIPCGLKFAWSPDGMQFAAACKLEKHIETIVIFNSDGSLYKEFAPISTSEETVFIGGISWSPDGYKILYSAGKDRVSLSIYISDINTLNNYSITTQLSNYSDLFVYSIP